MSDAMLSKVRKLLAKAEDPACTMAEAEAFTAVSAPVGRRWGWSRVRRRVAAPTSAVRPCGPTSPPRSHRPEPSPASGSWPGGGTVHVTPLPGSPLPRLEANPGEGSGGDP